MSKKRTVCPATGHRFRVSKRSSWWRHSSQKFTASLEISIDNPRCSGSYLECMLLWARSRFSEFVFSIGDTLRVHNYISIGHPAYGVLNLDAANEVATTEGEQWLANNKSIIEYNLKDCSYHFIFWEQWKKHPNFESYVRTLRNLFDEDPAFQKLVLDDLEDYIRRQASDALAFAQTNLECLAEYVFEELAVYQIQAEQGAVVNIYPGGRMKVFRNASTVSSLPPTLRERHFAYLDFADDPAVSATAEPSTLVNNEKWGT